MGKYQEIDTYLFCYMKLDLVATDCHNDKKSLRENKLFMQKRAL